MINFRTGTIIALIGAIAAGAAAFGELYGRVSSLEKRLDDMNMEEEFDRLIKKAKSEIDELNKRSLSVEIRQYDLKFDNTGTHQNLTLWSDADACFLNRISGKFEGGGELVEIVKNKDTGWHLQGHSRQIDVRAGAICIKYSFK